eukprot:TRINITY_DN12025_c0_g1_i1.p1 TRINITY_DN12025_c0_g1~~TRINITY_DN12025_c0_g1_i1.p1  ORF type:complete len:569 (+),score=194.92 TRINITY_DN12025_c0_g1_i1:66-1709(+)
MSEIEDLFQLCVHGDGGLADGCDAREAFQLYSQELRKQPQVFSTAFHTATEQPEPPAAIPEAAVTAERFEAVLRREAARQHIGSEAARAAVATAAVQLRRALRRRFMMFGDAASGADVEQPALALKLCGGPRGLAMYEELFTVGCRMTRSPGELPLSGLRRLLEVTCPSQHPKERVEMLRVAHVPAGAGGIDLSEFVVLMRGARLPRCLGDIVEAARLHADLLEAPPEDPKDSAVILPTPDGPDPGADLLAASREKAKGDWRQLDMRVVALDQLRKTLLGDAAVEPLALDSGETVIASPPISPHATPSPSPRRHSAAPLPPPPPAQCSSPHRTHSADRKEVIRLENQVLEQRRRAAVLEAQVRSGSAGEQPGDGPAGGAAAPAKSYADFVAAQKAMAQQTRHQVSPLGFEPYAHSSGLASPPRAADRSPPVKSVSPAAAEGQHSSKSAPERQQSARALDVARRRSSRRLPPHSVVEPPSGRSSIRDRRREREPVPAAARQPVTDNILVESLGQPAEVLAGASSTESVMRRLQAIRAAAAAGSPVPRR